MSDLKHVAGSLALAMALLLASPASAQKRESGVRGGGEIIDVNGHPELLDLVAESTCKWMTGEQLLGNARYAATARELKIALEALAKLDWYFAADLRDDIESLNFCMTGEVRKLTPRYRDVLVPFAIGTKQAAVRINGDVYTNRALVESLSAHSQAYFLIHESIHSYMAMHLPQRDLKLRSIVSTIADVESGAIKTRAELHQQLAMNGIHFPLHVDQLDAHREFITFFMTPVADRPALLAAIKDPNEFFKPRPEIIPYLAPWHRDFFDALMKHPLAALLNYYVIRKEEATANGMLASILPALAKSMAKDFADRDLVVHSARISANAALVRLFYGRSIDENTPVTSLPLDAIALEPALEFFLQTIASAYAMRSDDIAALALADPAFAELLSLKSLMNRLDEIDSPVARERGHAMAHLPRVHAAWIKRMIAAVRSASDEETAQKFETELMKLVNS